MCYTFQAYMAAEQPGKMRNEIRALAMDACTTLVTLEPKLTEASHPHLGLNRAAYNLYG